MISKENFSYARHLILKANSTFEEALILKNSDKYQGASNRLYYVLFYCVNALLVLRQLSSSKHSGVKSLFDFYFVKSGLIDKKYSKLFSVVRRIREDSDYDDFYIIDKVEVEQNITEVKEFIEYTNTFIDKVAKGEIELVDENQPLL